LAQSKAVQILGTRGVPAKHGGFETFAEQLSLFLVKRGWDVTVYCQLPAGKQGFTDSWNGIRRIHLSAGSGTFGTMEFDLKATLRAAKERGVPLVLGYNTAILSLLFRVIRRKSVMNMDGIEWRRQKWSPQARVWLRINEFLGARLSDHLVADHPCIKQHLLRHTRAEKITVIPYGAEAVLSSDETLLERFGVKRGAYFVVIARPEPENSILEIVHALSFCPRGVRLVLLGEYQPDKNPYHAKVLQVAGPECVFPGAIYDANTVRALRFYARAYLHGHQVGGTNPSLVEALGCGSAVIAHDNPFNRWVAGDAALYFSDELTLDKHLRSLTEDDVLVSRLQDSARARFAYEFTEDKVLGAYEALLEQYAVQP